MNTAHLLALELEGLPVTVFGHTEETARRTSDLARTGAQVTVVAPELSPTLVALQAALPGIVVRIAAPSPTDLDGQWLAVVADRNPSWVELLGPAARQKRVLFCAVDQPGHNTFSHVGVARAGHLAVGVSTQGRAPGLSAVLTRELRELFVRSRLEQLVESVVRLRDESHTSERSVRVREFVRHIRIDGHIVNSMTPPLITPPLTDEPSALEAATRKAEP